MALTSLNVDRIGFHGRRRCALTPATSRPLSELEQQGLIQAFEFTHELSWLLLKDFLVYQGVSDISGSRDAVREAVWNSRVCSRNAAGPSKADQNSQKCGKNHALWLACARASTSGIKYRLCLVPPSMDLRELLELGAALDDLLLP